MKLSELMREVEYKGKYTKDVEINNVTDDSEAVTAGTLFVCVRHRSFDGHSAAAEALKRGAAAVVSERKTGVANELLVTDTKKAYPALCAAFYRHPEQKLKMIGITGTNGKTTTSFLVQGILEAYSMHCGLIGTVHNITGDMQSASQLTTPKPPELYSLLYSMVEQGCVCCAMEASSQALDQGRLEGIGFDAAVFTNLTQDHLDYHQSFDNYLKAKQKLFESAALSVVNIDDPHAEDIIRVCGGEIKTYGIEAQSADYSAKEITLASSFVSYTLNFGERAVPIKFSSPGIFSVYNSMAAAATALELGVPAQTVSGALSMAQGVCGRMEHIDSGRGFDIIIDYAHTPDGLEQALKALRECCKGSLTAVFGCGGDRDKTKRPLMLKAAQKYADSVVVTSDNPRTENPQSIIDDILKGAQSGCDIMVEPDRGLAIGLALSRAAAGDTVLIAGKGHENYQIIGRKKLPFDDREVVRAYLAAD